MNKVPAEVKTVDATDSSKLLILSASKVTNGSGGGSIIEGSWVVWRSPGCGVPLPCWG